MTLKEALEQIKMCNFKDKIGHPLENNLGFIYLLEELKKSELLNLK